MSFDLKRGRHLLVSGGKAFLLLAVATTFLCLLWQVRDLYQQYVRLDQIRANNFEVQAQFSNYVRLSFEHHFGTTGYFDVTVN